ncbi:unnamed protein product [Trifolium pratense]|uniref:Uncharacterized protein n=1 Tax=Trifolium pratense TaxID=57577 RepID=A0ACB0KW35_TRIPR|nr:unnamed protein product [Trifolium pratense]
MKALTLIILTFSIGVFSHATPILVTHPQLQMNLSSTLNHTQQQINETRLSGSNCFYTIDIKTSCSSPENTTDLIGILVGDAEGNEVVATLDDPYIGMLKPCMTIRFNLLGSCIGKICKLYFHRIGLDGWMPETVTAYNIDDNSPITFTFNYFIHENQFSGFDYCHSS